LNPDVTPTLQEVCLKGLQKSQEARFQTAREFAAALEGALSA
jgi:hypothetical protein